MNVKEIVLELGVDLKISMYFAFSQKINIFNSNVNEVFLIV